MSTLFSPMVNAYWDHLNNDADYQALGLTEFRRIDGRLFQPLNTDDLSLTDLPAHACDSIKSVPELVTTPATWDIVTTLEGSIWYEATGSINEQSSEEIEHALAVIFDRLHGPLAVMSGMGDAVREYTFTFDDVQPIYPEDGDMIPAFWMANYTIVLRKIRGE